MRISNIMRRVAVLHACCLCGPLMADDLTLAGGTARLTGTVRSINEAGVVELASPLSPGPVLLKSGALEKVEFSSSGVAPEPPDSLVELANGDLLPAQVELLDDRKLTVVSPEAGRLEIPRDALKCMQFGIERRKVIYAGPRSLDEWTDGEGEVKNWAFERKSLVANGPAKASMDVKLPRKFILKFILKWQGNPNFQISFADPMKAKNEPSDRYYLQFNSAGLEIKREASQGRRFPPSIVLLNRTPDQYPDRQLQVEIRVDRKDSRLHLILNGEPEGIFIDPLPTVPDGSGIVLSNNASNGQAQEIRGIEILEFDDARSRHHAEERGDPKIDSLISREDDRWGGRLMEIRKTGEGPVFFFKSDFQKEPLEIPASEVSTVFFATKEGGEAEHDGRSFILRIRGQGSLRVSSCQFTDAGVTAVHPLLGPLKFPREGVVSMEWNGSKPKPAPEP